MELRTLWSMRPIWDPAFKGLATTPAAMSDNSHCPCVDILSVIAAWCAANSEWLRRPCWRCYLKPGTSLPEQRRRRHPRQAIAAALCHGTHSSADCLTFRRGGWGWASRRRWALRRWWHHDIFWWRALRRWRHRHPLWRRASRRRRHYHLLWRRASRRWWQHHHPRGGWWALRRWWHLKESICSLRKKSDVTLKELYLFLLMTG